MDGMTAKNAGAIFGRNDTLFVILSVVERSCFFVEDTSSPLDPSTAVIAMDGMTAKNSETPVSD